MLVWQFRRWSVLYQSFWSYFYLMILSQVMSKNTYWRTLSSPRLDGCLLLIKWCNTIREVLEFSIKWIGVVIEALSNSSKTTWHSGFIFLGFIKNLLLSQTMFSDCYEIVHYWCVYQNLQWQRIVVGVQMWPRKTKKLC